MYLNILLLSKIYANTINRYEYHFYLIIKKTLIKMYWLCKSVKKKNYTIILSYIIIYDKLLISINYFKNYT